MKQVVTVVPPHQGEALLEALTLAPLEALTVREVRGYGRQKSYLDQYESGEWDSAFVPKLEITLWVHEVRLEEVIERITDVTRTGLIGDGKIVVLPVGWFV